MSDSGQSDPDGLDPDIRRFVTAVQRSYGQYPDFDTLPLTERRRVAEEVRAPWRAGGPRMWRTVDTVIAGVRSRIHIPVEAPALGAMLALSVGSRPPYPDSGSSTQDRSRARDDRGSRSRQCAPNRPGPPQRRYSRR